MIWVIFFVSFLFTPAEVFGDRKGETKKGKIKDGIWLAVGSVLLAGVSWWFGQNPLSVLLLILGWRILLFDYLIQYVLIKRGVIVGHWFTYNGETAKFDKLIARIHPVVRLVIKVLIFVGSICFYLFL